MFSTKYRKRFIFLQVLCSVYFFSYNQVLHAEKILIFAASSLAVPLQEIANIYQKETSNRVNISFAASSTLARQIIKGAPADIYISANQKWMEFLIQKKPFIGKSKREILSNKLVIVSQQSQISSFKKITRSSIKKLLKDSRLAMGDPDHVPVGIYGKQALIYLKLWHQIKDRLARTTNVRAVLNLVEHGETAAGIVYSSDAHTNKKIHVVYNFPSETHNRISYWAALTKKDGLTSGHDFFRILFNSNSKLVFKEHGFLVN